MLAYDYKGQKWVDGDKGHSLRIEQLRQTIDLVLSPDGSAYAASIGFTDHEDLLWALEDQLTALL